MVKPMALTEAANDLLPLNNGGVSQSTSSAPPSEPAISVATPETNENTEQKARTVTKMDPPSQTSIKQNCSVQPSSSSTPPSSAFLSQFSSPKLLPASLPCHSPACCPFPEPECCNGIQQDRSLFQGSLHSRRALHMGPCCVQGAPSFCMQHQWQERFQNQPNMTTFSPARPFRFPKSYAALIADWPVVVLGVCTVLIVVCTLVGVLVPDLPDFSDPLLQEDLSCYFPRGHSGSYSFLGYV